MNPPLAGFPMWLRCVVGTVLLGVISCGGQRGLNDVSLPGGDQDAPWWYGDDSGSSGDSGQAPGVKPEVCDGLDNDLDGTVDEDLGGAPCTGTGGGAGVTVCVAGRLVCHECTPGDVRHRVCGCGTDTADVCNDSGRWVAGACDGCADLDQQGNCGVDAGCKPGEERVQRCDFCNPGDSGCGSNCMGALFRCDDNCTWQQVSTCAVQNPTCDRDTKIIEPCGKCGTHELRCDGCFFVEVDSACHDQGACYPGEVHAAPCFDNACSYGFTSTESCNAQCTWEAGSCEGCTPGTTETIHTLCIPGHPECGESVDRVQCVGQTTVSQCQGGGGAGSTEETSAWALEEQGNAGGGEACSCGDAPLVQGVGRSTNISNQCAGAIAPGYCTPGAVSEETVSCGAGMCGATYKVRSTCIATGCGVTTETIGSCPECAAGQTTYAGCDPGGGLCGSMTATCTASCTWGSYGACEAYSCPPPPPDDTPTEPPPPDDTPTNPPPPPPPPPM